MSLLFWPFIYSFLAFSAPPENKTSTFVVRPSDSLKERARLSNKNITILHGDSNLVERIPGLGISSTQVKTKERIKDISVRGLSKEHMGHNLGALTLSSSLNDQGQLELISLNDYSQIELSKSSDGQGATGSLKLNQLATDNILKLTGDGQDNRLYSVSLLDEKTGIMLKGNLQKIQNNYAVYNHLIDKAENLDHDHENYQSAQLQIPWRKKFFFNASYSEQKKELPGSFSSPLTGVTEEKKMYLGRLYSDWLSISEKGQLKGEIAFKGYKTNLLDPKEEVFTGIKSYQTNENQLALKLENKIVTENGRLQPDIALRQEKFLVENSQTSGKSTYSRQKIEMNFLTEQRMIGLNNLTVTPQVFYHSITDNYRSAPSQYFYASKENREVKGESKGLEMNAKLPIMDDTVFIQSAGYINQRVSSLTQKFGNGGLNRGNSELQNEKFKGFEIGVNYNNSNLKTELNYFFANPNDLIVYEQTSFNAWSPKNVGEAWIRGIEFSSEAKSNQWDLSSQLTLTYQQALNKSTDASVRGNYLPGRAPFTFSWWIEKDWEEYLKLRYTFSYLSPFFVDEQNKIEYPAIPLHSINLNSKLSKSLNLKIGLDNIFDKTKGEIGASDLQGNRLRALMDTFGNYIPGRTLRGELSYVF